MTGKIYFLIWLTAVVVITAAVAVVAQASPIVALAVAAVGVAIAIGAYSAINKRATKDDGGRGLARPPAAV